MPIELGGAGCGQCNRRSARNRAVRDKVHIAFTEWLFISLRWQQHSDAPRYDNMGGAIGTAGFFNMLMQNASIVPISDMTGIIEFAGIWKKRGRVYGTPSYYTFRLYSTAGPTPVAVESDLPATTSTAESLDCRRSRMYRIWTLSPRSTSRRSIDDVLREPALYPGFSNFDLHRRIRFQTKRKGGIHLRVKHL